MKSFSLLITSLLFWGSVSQAGHSDRLKDIQSRLNLSFCSLITEAQKIQLTSQLHQFLTATTHQDAYGFGKLVDSLYIDCPGSFYTPARTEFNSHLRGHSLIVNYDLSSLPLFEQRIPQEQQILAQLASVSSVFRRNLDFLSQTTASNESFLELVTVTNTVLASHIPATLRDVLDEVVITHENNSYSKASAALVPSFYKKDKKVLLISVGQTDVARGDHPVLNAEALSALVGAVAENGFVQIDTSLLDSGDVNPALVSFANFLTPATKQLLTDNKVQRIRFTAQPLNSQDLFKDGTLTLGTTVEDDNAVVDLLFN